MIARNQAEGGQLAVEAGTGLGKTVSALFATHQEPRRLVYATRTNSQQTQVMREHAHLDGMAIPFMGRKHYCPLLKDDERFKEGNPEELGRLCKHAKRKATEAHATGRAVKGACPYYQRLLEDGTGPVEALLKSGSNDPADLARRIAEAGSCAYEAYKLLMPQAATVIVPYVFVLDTRLRNALLEWMGTTIDACHLVVDEAHNLPDATRSHHSPRLGLTTIERAMQEAEKLHDPILAGKVLSTTFLTKMHEVLRTLVSEHVAEQEDGWMPPGALEESLMMALRTTGPALQAIAGELEAWGEEVREQRRREGRLPRSYLGAVGDFLRTWWQATDAPYVHLAIREPRPALEAHLLEPSARLAWLHEFASATFMSGTLEPESFAMVCGLQGATATLPTPFDPDALQTWGLRGMQRSHVAITEDPSQIARQQAAGRQMLATWEGRIGVWFPSHAMMEDYLEEGFLHGLDAEIFQEESGMSTPDLMRLVQRFRGSQATRALLVGVLGGRLTEGIDYPGDAMERMILMGIPYPKPSARSQALIHHYDVRCDAGWRIAVHEPVGRVLRQAVGRLVRGPEDRGLAVVLDERIVRFPDRFDRLRMADHTQEVDMVAPAQEGFQRADQVFGPKA